MEGLGFILLHKMQEILAVLVVEVVQTEELQVLLQDSVIIHQLQHLLHQISHLRIRME